MTLNRTHLDQLENQSIFIFREAYHGFKKIATPWSMGKDSNEIRDFTGIDARYEAPEGAEIVVRTDRQSVDESVATILEQLLPRLKADEPND